MDVSVRQGHLVVTPVKAPTCVLSELVAGISKRNVHTEVDFGPARGREAW